MIVATPGDLVWRHSRRRLVVVLAAVAISTASFAGRTGSTFTSSTANGGNVFTAAAAASCPTTQLNPVWVSGNEYARATIYGGGVFNTGDNLGSESTVVRTGGYSFRATLSGTAKQGGRLFATPGPNLVARFGVSFSALPTSDVSELAGAYMANGGALRLKYVAATQKLALAFANGATAAAHTSIQAGSWYLVEIGAGTGATSYTADWRIDGATQPQATATGTVTTIDKFMWGSSFAETYTAYYDDLIVSQTAADFPIGNGKVLALRPNAMAATSGATNFSNQDGTAIDADSYSRLADPPYSYYDPAQNVNVYPSIKQTTVSTSSYVGIAFQDTTETCIRAVAAYVGISYAGSATASHGKTVVLDGATERTVWNGDHLASSTPDMKSLVVAPASSPWTQGALNGLVARIGYSSDVRPTPEWHSLMLEYEVPQ